MITVRDVVAESLYRGNLVSRRQSIPADMIETGLRLLKSIAARYSNDNLLQFLRADVVFDLNKSVFLLGIDVPDDAGYASVDVAAPQIQRIASVYIRSKLPNALDWTELQYCALEDFDNYSYGCNVYTCQQINDKQMCFKVKEYLAEQNAECKVVYSKKWDFDLDSELRIPEQYSELFITALTYKLALTFPRLSPEQTNLLKSDLAEMEQNLRVSTRAHKFITRNAQPHGCNLADFISGKFLGL